MAIGSNYPEPVYVNGYSCKNCTDVDYAKKNIDPAHPQDGPFGIDAKNDPAAKLKPAVTYGGVLSGLGNSQNVSASAPSSSPTSQTAQTSQTGVGTRYDVSV